MKIAYSKTRERFPLSPKKIWKKTIGATFGYSIFLLVIAAWLLTTTAHTNNKIVGTYIINGMVIFVALIVIIFIVEYFYQRWYYAVYFYELTDDFVIIKKGPITPVEVTIPYERIQDVYVDQDVLDRLFRLYDVHVSSATISSGRTAHIDGVEKEAADGLRAILLSTVQTKIGRNKGGV